MPQGQAIQSGQDVTALMGAVAPVDRSQWDRRADGSAKGDGFLGVLNRPDGKVSSEISIGVNIDGKEVEIPTLVPTLTADEKQWLLNNDVSDPSKLPPAIIQKAVDFARPRIAAGKSPFAGPGESPQAPKPGDDVTALMTQTPDFRTENEKDDQGNAKWYEPGGDVVLDNLRRGASIAADVVEGAKRRLYKTGVEGGALLRKIPGVNALDQLVTPVQRPIEPENTAQRVGGFIEQAAEVAAPSRAVYQAGVKAAELAAPRLAPVVGETAARMLPRALVEGAGSAALAKAQGATDGEAAGSAVLGAVAPTIGEAAVAIASKLREGAARDVGRFFNATTKGNKRVIAQRTPEILARGADVLGGVAGQSREGAVEAFGAVRERLGEQIDEALSLFGRDDVTDAPARLIAALNTARSPYIKRRLLTPAEATGPLKRFIVDRVGDGAYAEIPLNATKVRQIEGLKAIVQAHGDTMTVNDLVGLRRAWDEVAYDAPGATLQTVKNKAEKWAKKMGGDAIRAVLASDAPQVQALNREFAFWKSIEDVMAATVERKQGQVGGLIAPMAEGGGRVVGGMLTAGKGLGTAVGGVYAAGKLAKLAQRVFESPRYASVAAKVKQDLADAIMNGSGAQAEGALRGMALRVGVIEAPQMVGAATR